MIRLKIGLIAVALTAVVSTFPASSHENVSVQNSYSAVTSGQYKDYVLHLPSKKWLQRQVQVRVSQHRKLPHPLDDARHGDYIHTTDFFPEGCSSGSLVPTRYSVHDGYKVWQFTNTVDADDLKGMKAFGIGVDFPEGESKIARGPMEIFYYPPLKDEHPERWSEWIKAGSQRHGVMAWWSEVHKQKPEAHMRIEHPFELRWRMVLKDDPVRVMDDGIVEGEKDASVRIEPKETNPEESEVKSDLLIEK